MRRRLGIPFTIALLVLAYMAKPYSPIEPYYLLVGATALWAAIDSRRLNMSEHSSSALASPVGLLAWMAIAWPIAFPWYLKARYHVSRGEPVSKAGGSGSIRLAFYGLFILVVVGGGFALKSFPTLKNMLLFSGSAAKQFGASVNVNLDGNRNLELTVDRAPLDSASDERFARHVAEFARTGYAGADSLRTIAVVLQQKSETGSISVSSKRSRFSWTPASLASNAAPVATVASGTNKAASQHASPDIGNAASVIPAGSPAGTAAGATRGTTRGTTNKVAPAAAPAAAPPSRKPVATDAYTRLAAADPMVSWVTDSAIVADIDCDQRPDTVVVGRRRAEVHVGFARAAGPEPEILIFDVGRGKDVSSPRAAMSLESLDWDPADRGIVGLEGFQRSSSCKGIMLGDGDSNNVHMFWSLSTRHVEWYHR